MMQRLTPVSAEFELDRIRESWNDARRNAVERGIHGRSSATPAGYVRDDSRVLQVDPKHRPRRSVRHSKWPLVEFIGEPLADT
jgi:hypothetical protein